MKNPLDDLDEDLLSLLLSTLERQHQVALTRREEADAEVLDVERKIDRVRDKIGKTMFPELPALTLSGRVKKGESERLISAFMQSRNGAGASIHDVAKATSTNYGTARRILRKLVESGNATETKGLFRWTENNLSARGESEGATANGKAKLRLLEC